MDEYIIKQKVEYGKENICRTCRHVFVCRAVENQPCTECNRYDADFARVTHGHWIDDGMDCVCSICGCRDGASNTRYCPDCGAKMDLEG